MCGGAFHHQAWTRGKYIQTLPTVERPRDHFDHSLAVFRSGCEVIPFIRVGLY